MKTQGDQQYLMTRVSGAFIVGVPCVLYMILFCDKCNKMSVIPATGRSKRMCPYETKINTNFNQILL